MKSLGSKTFPVVLKEVLKVFPKFHKTFFKKLIAYSVLITFTTTQVAWGQDYTSQERSVHEQSKAIHEVEIHDAEEKAKTKNLFDFLSDDSPLSAVESLESETAQIEVEEKTEKEEESNPIQIESVYEMERYSVEYAAEILRPEYAAAVILEEVTEEDIETLLNLDFEVAVVVLEGEIVLFSTGNEEEIGLLSPAKAILDRATFVSHTHVKDNAQDGPSDLDLNEAVEAPEREYVLTTKGAYSYNQDGLLNQGRPVSLKSYIEALNFAKTIAPVTDQVQARAFLNQFIYEMDLYNSATPEAQEVFRASRTFLSVEAEDMSETGDVWLGNENASLNSDGELYMSRELDSGVYQFEIHAFGRDGGGIEPLMYAKVNEDLAGAGVRVERMGGNYQKYIFEGIKLESGMHKFAAEFIEEHAWQSIVIDKFVIKKTDDLPGPVYTLEGEAMNTEKGYNYVGSESMLLWGNDRLYQDQTNMEAGVYEIEVVALGIEGNGALPKIQAGVNYQVAGEPSEVTYNDSNYASYTFKNIEVEAGTNSIFAQFINDSGPRDVWIDKVIARKVSDLPEVRSVLEPENMTLYSGWNGGNYVTVWSNGDVKTDHTISESGRYEIEVIAQGYAGGHSELPKMRVSVDNGMVTDEIGVPYTMWNYKGYKFSDIELTAGTHNFEVGILSGLSGQSLAIEKIIIRKTGEIIEEANRYVMEAETMTGDASTWFGSNYVSMWSNGDINKDQTLTESGVYEIEVVALGEDNGTTPLPALRMLVDETMISDVTPVTRNSWNYKSYKYSGIELSAGTHNFKAGILDGLSGQNLGVERIIIRKTGEIPNEENRIVTQASDMTASGGVWDGGNYVSMWSNGTLQTNPNLDESGVYEIVVEAIGDPGSTGVLPEMKVSLDGSELATPFQVSNNTWNYKQYTFADIQLLSGAHNLKIELENWISDQTLGVRRVFIRKTDELPIYNVTVDAGDFTGTRDITLALDGAEGYEGDLEMRFAFNSQDESAYSAWEPFSATKAVQIPNWEGTNYVNVQLRDSLGNVRFLYDTVIYDKTVPTGTLVMNGGATYTRDGIVTVSLDMTDNLSGPYKMRFQKGSSQPWTEWMDYSSTATFDNVGPQGTRWIIGEVMDRAGNIKGWLSDSIILEGTAPSGTVLINNGDSSTTSKDVTLTLSASDNLNDVSEMRFSTDGGMSWTGWEIFATNKTLSLGFDSGLRTVLYEVRDSAGNSTVFSDDIQYTPNDMTLADGTLLQYFSTSNLVMESTPDNEQIFYYTDGRVNFFRFPNNEEIHYLNSEPHLIEIRDSGGNVVEQIDVPTPTVLNESEAVRVTLDEGIVAYYLDGELSEIRSNSGIRLTDIEVDSEDNIVEAFIIYPDGAMDIIRFGSLIRRINGDGSILDFTPTEFSVREIVKGEDEQGNTTYDLRYFFFDKVTQDEVAETKIFTLDGKNIFYDELGMLKRATDSGVDFIYGRETIPSGASAGNETGYKVALDLDVSSVPEDETLFEAIYTPEGQTVEITFYDRTRIEFDESGQLDAVYDPEGNVVDYGYLEENGFSDELHVGRGDSQFVYNKEGFLSEVETSGGTIYRSEQDSNNDGVIDEDDEVALTLETLDGSRLLDFELDSVGNITDGIIETKEGIKQTIENGVLTGFETVDGKVYDVANGQATLKEWKVKDGTRVVFASGEISDILFPNGSRLHTIGFDEDKQVSDYIEELEDGTKKYFVRIELEGQRSLRLEKIITSEGNQIFYDYEGLAREIILADASEFDVVYKRNAETDAVEEISFVGLHNNRTFSPDGALLRLLKDGVSAEIENEEVSRLFTRFGDVDSGDFDENGVLSGDIEYEDGTVLTIQDGDVLQAVRPSGTVVNYASGRVDTVQTSEGTYQVLYTENAGLITDLRLSFNDGTTTEEYPLIVHLLENSDSEISDILFGRPLHDAVHDFRTVHSVLDSGDSISVAQRVLDVDRGLVFEIGNEFSAEFNGVDMSDGGFTLRYNSESSPAQMGAKTSEMLDMNGDGLVDRLYISGSDWYVQLHNGLSFNTATQWTGVDLGDKYLKSHVASDQYVQTDLMDMDGDGRPDRILQSMGSANEWYVQINNGAGFDAPALWADNLQILNHGNNSADYAVSAVEAGTVLSELVDLDGDGKPDRIVRPLAPQNFDHWWFQKNTGSGFADAVIWEGVDSSFDSDSLLGSSIAWEDMRTGVRGGVSAALFDDVFDKDGFRNYVGTMASLRGVIDTTDEYIVEFYDPLCNCIGGVGYGKDLMVSSKKSDLADIDGDGLVDRLLLKEGTDGLMDWYVQVNNGSGFDAAKLMDDDVRSLPFAPNTTASSGFEVYTQWNYSNKLVDLVDVTGDGLLDRVSVDTFNDTQDGFSTWWVEENTGVLCEETESEECGFKEAVAWDGIYGDDRFTSSIGQDRLTESAGFSGNLGGAGLEWVYDRPVSSLEDMNGDGILDRVVFIQDEDKWVVQYGTGNGFLPIEDIEIDGIEQSLSEENIHSARYDYLHISLKSDVAFPAADGLIKVTLDDPSSTDSYQEWTVTDLTTDWQDFYLPLSSSQLDASKVKVEFVPVNSSLILPVHVDNITFTKLRPDATKDWLDRFLTEEDVLAEIDSEATQTLAQFLGLSEADDASAFDWDSLLLAETRIDFDSEGEATEFETLYGSITQLDNGAVTQTTKPDGTVITFETPDPLDPNTITQTTTDSQGNTETIEVSYGRVRTLTNSEQTLEYSYEFDEEGREITAVTDPADESGIVERYMEVNVLGETVTQLISRTTPAGVVTSFEYNELGELAVSKVSYKGRVKNTFFHGKTEEGFTTLRTSEGIVEEYDSEGKIQYHTNPEGFRYKHEEVTARTAVITNVETSIDLPDGITLTYDVPTVTMEECTSDCEEIERITITSFTSGDGEIAEYSEEVEGLKGESEVSGLLLLDGTRINISKVERTEEVEDESGEAKVSYHLLDATVFHSDGTITEFRGGLPYLVTSATGTEVSVETEDGLLINPNESAQFHYNEADDFWNEVVLPKWEAFRLPGAVPVQTEYSLEGELVSRKFAEGAVELYDENGNHEQTISSKGERLTLYAYDAENNIIDIDLEGPRRNLLVSEMQVRADIAMQKEAALAHLYEREQVLDEQVEGEYVIKRDELLEARNNLLEKLDFVSKIDAKGSSARDMVRGAIDQINGALNQVNQALIDLANQRAEALEDLNAGVESAEADILTQASDALISLETELDNAAANILEQEVAPVIYHWYREILGRDPSQAEAQVWLDTADPETGEFDLDALKNDSSILSEKDARLAEVTAIQNALETELLDYLAKTDQEKETFLASLGIQDEAVTISSEEVTQILEYLGVGQSGDQNLHFGQSAFIALEAMLEDASIAFTRVDLATKLILIDILTGTITPFEESDLVLSMYSLRRVGDFYGLNMTGLAITFEGLKAIFEDACAGQNPCDFRLVAHVDGNHYIIITGFEERVRLDKDGNPVLDEQGEQILDEYVKFIDPGTGSNEEVELLLAKFLEIWLDPRNPEDGFGFVLSPRPPPASQIEGEDYRLLTSEEELTIRGSFFGLFIATVITVIVQAVVAAVAAIVAAIQALIAGLIAGLSSILTGVAGFFANIVQLNFIAAFQSLFGGILTGLGEIAIGVFNGFVAFGKTFVEVFSAGGFGFGGGFGNVVQGVSGSFKALGAKLTSLGLKGTLSGFIKTSLVGLGLQGVGSLAEAIGISPKITRTIIAGGKIIAGVALLATGNPVGLGFIAGATSEILNTHTSLSPTVTGLIGIGAAAVGAFAGGFLDAGTLTGALDGLKSAIPALSMDLASSGVVAVGNEIGIDPRLSSLIAIPVRAAVGSVANNLVGNQNYTLGYRDNGDPIIVTSSDGIMSHVKDSLLSKEMFETGISVGTSFVLDETDAHPVLKSYLPRFAGELASGFLGSGSGGGGSGGPTPPGTTGDDFIDKLGKTVKNIGQTVTKGVKKVGEAVTSFGSIVANGFGQAIKKISYLIPNEIREIFIGEGNGDLSVGVDENTTVNGDITSSTFGNYSLTYDNVTKDAVFTNDRLVMTAHDVEIRNDNSLFVANISISEQLTDNIFFDYEFQNGNIVNASVRDANDLIYVVNPLDANLPLTFDNDGRLLDGIISTDENSYSLMNGSIISLSQVEKSTFEIDGVTVEVDTFIQAIRKDNEIDVKTGILDLPQSVKDSLLLSGTSPAALSARLIEELGKDDFDTNLDLIQLKADIENGSVNYETFTQDHTQLGRVSQSQLDLNHTGLFSDGWQTVDGYPIEIQQSKLSQAATILGMSFVGVGASENTDPLVDQFQDLDAFNVPMTMHENGTVVAPAVQSTATFKASSNAVAEFSTQLNNLSAANRTFVENNYGTYTVVRQEKDGEERYLVIVGKIEEGKTEYRVVHQPYVEDIMIGVKGEN